MIKFAGTLNRTGYWKNFIGIWAGVILLATVLGLILESLNANEPSASALAQVLAVTVFGLLLVGLLTALAALLGVTVRRARDAGDVVVWTGIAVVLLCLGPLLLGLVSSRR